MTDTGAPCPVCDALDRLDDIEDAFVTGLLLGLIAGGTGEVQTLRNGLCEPHRERILGLTEGARLHLEGGEGGARHRAQVKFHIADDRVIPSTKEIATFMHCGMCLAEMPSGKSAAAWARLEIGLTPLGLQIWCTRHDRNVAHIDFQGMRHPMNNRRSDVRRTKEPAS
jgi:hypothetical protein